MDEIFDAGEFACTGGALEQKTEIRDRDADGIVRVHLLSKSDLGVFRVG